MLTALKSRPNRTVLASAGTAALVAVLALTSEPATQALLLGLGSGCLVAAIALGVVLTFRGSGMVNFATGALAMFSAYFYDGLRRDGTLFLPPLPSALSVGSPLAFAPALLLTLLLSALLGAVMHVLVFRPLRQAPPLARVVASIGLLVVLQALVVLRFDSTPRPVAPVLDKEPIRLLGDIVLPRDQLVVAGVVTVLTLALWAMARFTRFGLATRAAAENEQGAAALGFSPNRLALGNLMLSSALVGGLGVLVATVNGSTDPITVTYLIVPALAAALLAGFSSFAVAAAAGIGIAMLQSLLQYWSAQDWFPQTSSGAIPGLRETVPLALIVTVLLIRGHTLPERGAPVAGRLPRVPPPVRALPRAMVVTLVCFAGLALLGPDWRLAITNSSIGAIICLSLVVLTGFVGQISLAQMALAGVSGFTVARLSDQLGVPFPVAPLLGAVAATLVGLATALPAMRVRGVNLAVLTLAAAVAIESLVFRNPALSGGLEGANVPAPALLGLRFGPGDDAGGLGDGKLPNPWFGVFCVLVCLCACLAVVALRRSDLGMRMLAVRSDERAAAGAGVDVLRTKLCAFGVAAFIAGLGGALSAYRFGSVSPSFFGVGASLSFLAFAYLGGITSVTGAVCGGMLVTGGLAFTALRQWAGVPDDFTVLISGIGLILTAVLNPEGIAGALSFALRRVQMLLPSSDRGSEPEARPLSAAP